MIIENTIKEIKQENDRYQALLDEQEKKRWEEQYAQAEKISKFKKGDLIAAHFGTHLRPQVVMVTKVCAVTEDNDVDQKTGTFRLEQYEVMMPTGQMRHLVFSDGTHPDATPVECQPVLIKRAAND